MDTRTRYLGLSLEHPFIVGASPMVNYLDTVRRLEDAGAAAIVMYSLFEEQIQHHQEGVEEHILSYMDGFSEAKSFFPSTLEFALGPEKYLEHIAELKETVSIPLIASLNGTNIGTWTDYARLMEEAGADALELNLFFLSTDPEASSQQVEDRCIDVVRSVCESTTIPIAVKISPFFTSLPHFAKRLGEAGASGLVLFNRFYQQSIDVENLKRIPPLKLTDSSGIEMRLRWLSILHGRANVDLALTGGVHDAQDAIKGIMAGADAVQVVSALLLHGPEYLRTLHDVVVRWMDQHGYTSMSEMRGSMSYRHSQDPAAIERSNYMNILQSWTP